MEQSSIHRWRQQSVPHSGVREALLAPMAAPALPDVARSSSCARKEKEEERPHSGVREALLAPTAAPALPDVGRSIFLRRRSRSALSYIKNPTHQFQISP